jgi:hypothetical protein
MNSWLILFIKDSEKACEVIMLRTGVKVKPLHIRGVPKTKTITTWLNIIVLFNI